MRNSFQRDPVFQFSNRVNISTAMTSSKDLLFRNPIKTATFNGHAKLSLIKNATKWYDTDSCYVADVGVSYSVGRDVTETAPVRVSCSNSSTNLHGQQINQVE